MLDVLARALRPTEERDPSARAVVGPWALFALVAAFAVAYALLARFGLDAYPWSGDEYSYELQAEIFARGRLSMPTPPHAELLQADHVLLEPAVRSKYPPGWPALLAVGAAARAPWLVNPVLGALTLALLFRLSRRLAGEGAALATTLVVGCSPFFAFNAASLGSHTSSLFALVLCVACVAAGWERRALAWAALGGAALGFAALNRQLDALLFAAGLAALAPRAPRYLATCAAAAVAVASLLLAYDAAQFGSPWTTGYALYEPTLRRLYGDTNASPLTLAHLLDPAGLWAHVQWLGQLAAWLTPGLLVAGVAGLARSEAAGSTRGGMRRWMLAVGAAQLVVMLFYGHDAGPSYGPRYLFSLLAPVAVGMATAWGPLWRWARHALSERAVALAFAGILAAGVLRGGFLLDAQRDVLRHSTQLYELAGRLHLHDAVVILRGPWATRFTHNGCGFDGPVLYVAPVGSDDRRIASEYPDRAIYVARRASETSDWTLEALR